MICDVVGGRWEVSPKASFPTVLGHKLGASSFYDALKNPANNEEAAGKDYSASASSLS